MDVVVPDANTLIYLAKADIIDLLDPHRVLVGERVYKEAVVAGKEKGASDAYLLEKHIKENFDRFEENLEEFEKAFEYFGAPGETETYLIADQKEALAITSEDIALKRMKRRGVDAIKTDMMLLKQFKNDIIGRRTLESGLRELRSVNGTTSERISFIIEKSRKLKGGEK